MKCILSCHTQVPVSIRVLDINDSPPSFDTEKITLYVAENSPVGSSVGEIYAHDPDEGPNAVVQYSIIGNTCCFFTRDLSMVSFDPLLQ